MHLFPVALTRASGAHTVALTQASGATQCPQLLRTYLCAPLSPMNAAAHVLSHTRKQRHMPSYLLVHTVGFYPYDPKPTSRGALPLKRMPPPSPWPRAPLTL